MPGPGGGGDNTLPIKDVVGEYTSRRATLLSGSGDHAGCETWCWPCGFRGGGGQEL